MEKALRANLPERFSCLIREDASVRRLRRQLSGLWTAEDRRISAPILVRSHRGCAVAAIDHLSIMCLQRIVILVSPWRWG
jgi:hypothetical protein